MDIKSNNSNLIINGGDILKAIVVLDVLFHIHKAMIVAERKYYDHVDYELKALKREQKLSKKKAKKERKHKKLSLI